VCLAEVTQVVSKEGQCRGRAGVVQKKPPPPGGGGETGESETGISFSEEG